MFVHLCLQSIIHNSQKVEAAQVPINECMKKQNAFAHSGILFSLKVISDACYNMGELCGHYERSQTYKDKYCMTLQVR